MSMKVYYTISNFTNTEVLTEHHSYIDNKRNASEKCYQRNNDLSFDDDVDDFNKDFESKSEYQLIINDHDEENEQAEFDPDDDVFHDWSPSRHPKKYRVNKNSLI